MIRTEAGNGSRAALTVTPGHAAVVRVLAAAARRWVKPATISAETGLPDRTARRYLRRLCDGGIVEQQGGTNRSEYRLADTDRSRAYAALAALLYPDGC